MAKDKATIKEEPVKEIKPNGRERFYILVKPADDYPLLSVHEFEGVRYRVDALLAHPMGTAVEFVRVA